jgi:predicted Rossmann fold flavoprotein
VKKLAGLTLPDMKIVFFLDGKRAFAKKGRLLFTHFGLSGPLILNSAHLVHGLLSGGTVTCTIDAFPDTDFAELEQRVVATIDANKNKNFKNVVDDIVPGGMGGAYMSLFKLPDPKLKAHSLTKEDRKRFVHLLKELPAAIEGLMGYDRAIVSDGGVPLTEVDTRTMRSLKVPNLYLIGDVLHINRPSGGYSLQLCWTTGFVAGDNV